MRKAALYVDGFNFYYGVRNHFKAGEPRRGFSLSGLVWCDFRALVERHFLEPDTKLLRIRYFTAPVTEQVEAKQDEHARYENWLRAARTIPGLQVIFGYYRPRRKAAKNKEAAGDPLAAVDQLRQEKETDVNIAVEMLLDAIAGQFDTAYLLSGDTDQIPAVAAAAFRLRPHRRVRVLVPPVQDPESWKKPWLDYMHQLKQRFDIQPSEPRQVDVLPLTEEILANSLLRYDLPEAACPPYWRLPADYLDRMCRPEWRPERAAG
ncbi:MAG: NYN domain-containing protein [Bryobacteraceae bacterium]|nr:NYN domain-containing protein [Bryobacteraceae bacterium]